MTSSKCPIKKIVKRDGNVVDYDRDRIATAIFKAAAAVGGKDRDDGREARAGGRESPGPDLRPRRHAPSVEEIQDMVEATLIKQGHVKTARAYIIYRHERAKARAGPRLHHRGDRQHPVQEDLRGPALEHGPRLRDRRRPQPDHRRRASSRT